MKRLFLTLLMVLLVAFNGTALAEDNDAGPDADQHAADAVSLEDTMLEIMDEQAEQELNGDEEPSPLYEDNAQEMEQKVDASKTFEADSEINGMLYSQPKGANDYPPYISPYMNGRRVKHPDYPYIWLIEGGQRRAIPNAKTYNLLFPNWHGIEVGTWVTLIKKGNPLANGTRLIKGDQSGTIYVLDHFYKRPIPSRKVFNQYYFDWGKVTTFPQWFVNQFPTGPSWKGPS